ncbi:hypothetical protein GW17_00042895 [Ensete ventricosum]|nr:hypothetical protein GW17_00042895 [Ensete ventricosum]
MHSRIGATMTVNFWSHGITLSHAFHGQGCAEEVTTGVGPPRVNVFQRGTLSESLDHYLSVARAARHAQAFAAIISRDFAQLRFVKAERSLVALSLLRGSNPPTSDDDLAALAGGNGDLLGFLLDMFLFSKEGKKLLA